MNPDPNQPQTPTPAENPTPAPSAIPAPEAPASYAAEPVVAPVTPAPEATPAPTTPNPFGASATSAPVSPFGAAAGSTQPVGPIGSAPAGSVPAYTPGDPKKKKIILLSAIIGGIIVLLGAALAVYFLFFSVTKADYQKAYDQVKIVRDASSSSNVSLGSSEDSVANAKESYEKFKTENAKLASLKAFRGDSELKEKYDAYNAKAKAYIKFADDFIPSLEAFAAATKEVTGSSGSASFSSATFQKTIDAYKAADIKDPSLKAFVDSTVAAYEEMLPQVKIYESSSSTSAQKSAAIKAMTATITKLSTAGKTMSDDLKERTEAVKYTDELNELGKATTAKLNAK